MINPKKIIYAGLWLFLLAYLVIYSIKGDYEFLIYVAVTMIVLGLVRWADKSIKFSAATISMFGVWIVSHMFGGSLYLNGVKFYDVMIFPIIGEPYNILKYDQVVHFFLYFVVAMMLFTLAKKYTKINWYVIVLIILSAEGIGALNEVIEFSTTVISESTGVGGYINNALDLIFNLAGAILGTVLAVRLDKNKARKSPNKPPTKGNPKNKKKPKKKK